MIVTVACVVPPTRWQPVSARLLVAIVIFSKRVACVADVSGGWPSVSAPRHGAQLTETAAAPSAMGLRLVVLRFRGGFSSLGIRVTD
ncbi:MAG: hypothetical protein QOF84_4942 [Streptomyces sp.]|jgi:hypothetical protein|nr:hypothetical protein [Streptomyces sp.]